MKPVANPLLQSHPVSPGITQLNMPTKETTWGERTSLWIWEENNVFSFHLQPWLFSAKVPCYQILKLYWLWLAWKSDFIVGSTFDLGFCSVCGSCTAELPGLSCGELMWEFTAEVEAGETIKGRQSLDSPRKPQDCALQRPHSINTLHKSYYRSRPFCLQSRLARMWY